MNSENAEWIHPEEWRTVVPAIPISGHFNFNTNLFEVKLNKTKTTLTIRVEGKKETVKLQHLSCSYSFGGSPTVTLNVGDSDDGKAVIVIPVLTGKECALHFKATSVLTCAKEFQNVLSDLEKLFLSKNCSDVNFDVAGEIIPAHKAILVTRVPYFERMFASGMKEALTDCVKIEDAEPEAFKCFLKFIYCGKFLESAAETVHFETMLSLADKYGVDDLKFRIVDYWTTRLCQQNVLQVLILADLFSLAKLKTICLERVNKWRSSLPEAELEKLLDYPHIAIEIIKHK